MLTFIYIKYLGMLLVANIYIYNLLPSQLTFVCVWVPSGVSSSAPLPKLTFYNRKRYSKTYKCTEITFVRRLNAKSRDQNKILANNTSEQRRQLQQKEREKNPTETVATQLKGRSFTWHGVDYESKRLSIRKIGHTLKKIC